MEQHLAVSGSHENRGGVLVLVPNREAENVLFVD